jgi:hypothetical protein
VGNVDKSIAPYPHCLTLSTAIEKSKPLPEVTAVKKQQYAAERYEAIYDHDTRDDFLDAIGHPSVKAYRNKAQFCGEILENDVCATWNAKAQSSAARTAMREQSPETIENRNNHNAERRISQLLNTNFKSGDYAMYLSFRHEPRGWDEAHKALEWYIKALRKSYKAAGKELTYLYVYECANKDGEAVRQHFHIFINGEIDRDLAEDIWRSKYGKANSTRLEQDEYGLTGFGCYVLKAPRGVKNLRRWAGSQNLKQPDVTRSTRLPSGQRITKKLMLDMISGKKDIKEVFERAYRDYVFIDARTKYSQYASGVYLYVRMRKIKRE